MAPSTTIGAVISLWRKAATKVMVCHAPNGTLPITRSPRSARPLSRTRFVLTAVSSMNTSRAGSNMPCSRIHRRRASATSARCCSAACRLFFEGDAVSVEKPPERAAAGFDPPLAQLRNRFDQGQIRLFGNESQNRAGELFQRRNASAAWLRRGAPALAPALQPLDRRTHAHLKSFRRLASRCATRHCFDNAFPQVTRVGLRHRQPHIGESMHKDSLNFNRLGIPPSQIGREPLYHEKQHAFRASGKRSAARAPARAPNACAKSLPRVLFQARRAAVSAAAVAGPTSRRSYATSPTSLSSRPRTRAT